MKVRCFGCGVEKDAAATEIYPYEDLTQDEPIPALMTLDCEGRTPGRESDWRAVVVCHECFHRLEPDMWIDDRGWAHINPKVTFENLPALLPNPTSDITLYASTVVPP